MQLTDTLAARYLDEFFRGRPRYQRLAAFAAGSLVEGIGNTRSDIDLYVLTEDEVDTDGFVDTASGSDVTIDFLDGQRVDLETWRRSRLESLVERFAAFDPRHSKLYLAFSRHEIEFFHALLSGVALEGAELLEKYRTVVSPERFCAAMRHMALDASEGFVEDCLGALESDDLATATLMLRASQDGVVDALLAAHGVTNAKLFKWRQVFLDRVAGITDEWRDLYWDNQRVERPVAASQAVALRARLDEVRARALEIELELPFGTLSASPGRPPVVKLRRFDDGYLVVHLGAAVETDRVDAVLWAFWSDSAAPDPVAVARRLGRLFPNESGLTPQYVAQVVGQFTAEGIPGPHPASPVGDAQ